MQCPEKCMDCHKPTAANDHISYVGYIFHRRCFIRRVSKHVAEAKRLEIFEHYGIRAEEIHHATSVPNNVLKRQLA
jgi:hypothetical protein